MEKKSAFGARALLRIPQTGEFLKPVFSWYAYISLVVNAPSKLSENVILKRFEFSNILSIFIQLVKISISHSALIASICSQSQLLI